MEGRAGRSPRRRPLISPGLVVLADDGAVVTMTDVGARLLPAHLPRLHEGRPFGSDGVFL